MSTKRGLSSVKVLPAETVTMIPLDGAEIKMRVIEKEQEVDVDSSLLETLPVATAETLKASVLLPENEDLEEWYAANIVDFYTEVSLLYKLCREDGLPPSPDHTEGVKREILGNPAEEETNVSPTYIADTLSSIEVEIKNFPDPDTRDFDSHFSELAKRLFTMLFRVLALMYYKHYQVFKELDALCQLNTTFKRFAFFLFQFHLLEQDEGTALNPLLKALKREFELQ